MTSKVETFLASWKALSNDRKRKYLVDIKPQMLYRTTNDDEPKMLKGENVDQPTHVAAPHDVKKDVDLYSYYSYLYYYPTIHWALEKSPDTNHYWVGIFRKKSNDNDYITYHYVKHQAQGSYYCGKLHTPAGQLSQNRSEEFELRIFDGSRRLDAKTNVLRGEIIIAPAAPDINNLPVPGTQAKNLDKEIEEFMHAMTTSVNIQAENANSSEYLLQEWNTFTAQQQQLLYPILEQDSLPDRIKNPDPKDTDLFEPKFRYPNLGKTAMFSGVATSNPIVLTITIDYSYTYIYPVVDVKRSVGSKWCWMGMYHIKSDVSFNPDAKIDDDWQWVGVGHEGKTCLNYIKEYLAGPIKNQYVGVIFDYDYNVSSYVQTGLAASTIGAVINATPAIPPPEIMPDYEKEEALRYAKLSQLAYKSYDEVEKELENYGLVAEMEIKGRDFISDTNGFIASDAKSVVVAFRGTTNFKDFLTDWWFTSTLIDENGPAYGHHGFVHALNSVYSSIECKLKPFFGKKKLFITGHSLGGALATLLGYRLRLAHRKCQSIQYVYGCPPVGDTSLANFFQGMNSSTITIKGDPISSGGMLLLGPFANLYKPCTVMYLPEPGGHAIKEYIRQLEL